MLIVLLEGGGGFSLEKTETGGVQRGRQQKNGSTRKKNQNGKWKKIDRGEKKGYGKMSHPVRGRTSQRGQKKKEHTRIKQVERGKKIDNTLWTNKIVKNAEGGAVIQTTTPRENLRDSQTMGWGGGEKTCAISRKKRGGSGRLTRRGKTP